MKKKLLYILTLVVVALAIAVFVAPVGTGIKAVLAVSSSTAVESLEWSGYTVIFGNWANSYINEAVAANIAAFVLLVVGVVFQFIAAILLIPNPTGSKKFSGFLFVLGGLMELVFGVILLCCRATTGLVNNEAIAASYNLHLGVGVIISGAAAIIAAVASVAAGVFAWGNNKAAK